ncbi:MAG: glycoside hydrolase family 88 protein [Opitutaceae bacterium]
MFPPPSPSTPVPRVRFLLVSLLVVAGFSGAARADIESSIDNGLAFSAVQIEKLAGILRTNNRFPEYSNPAGVWSIKSRSSWCSGFTPGMFWYLYDLTGEDKFLGWAETWTEGVRARSIEADNDTGFQIFCSFGLGYTLTGKTDVDYLEVMKTAANTFATQRYNPTIGCYRAWRNTSSDPVNSPSITANTTNPNDMVFEVNVDMMMNMELPLFVGTNGGNPDYVTYAVSHADRTWEDLVRPDYSTYHVVGYKADGSVDYKRTAQGWKTESTWSRGQAWSVYGYTMVYRYTGLERMLDRADKVFDKFMAMTAAQTNDFVPFSDFDAPLDGSNSRDTSAAAIVASAALELYDMTGSQKYLDAARNILLSLGGPDYLAQGTAYQPILRKGCGRWGDPEEGTSFGDFYYLEAMIRHRTLFPVIEPPPAPSDAEFSNISTRGQVGTGANRLIAGFVVRGVPGATTGTVLIRAIGPGLSSVGVSEGFLVDPTLEIFSAADPLTAAYINDNWGDNANAAEIQSVSATVGAFDLAEGSLDAVLMLSLPPGVYTAKVGGKDGGTGVAIVEVYAVD